MLFKLLLLFILLPFVESVLLLVLADRTNLPTTLAIVIVTGMIGTWLARSQGLRTIQRIRDELAQGRLPAEALQDAAMILVAGILLLTPGLLTDAFGLSLLIPRCRVWYGSWLKSWLAANFRITRTTSKDAAEAPRSQVIDSYVIDKSDHDQP